MYSRIGITLFLIGTITLISTWAEHIARLVGVSPANTTKEVILQAKKKTQWLDKEMGLFLVEAYFEEETNLQTAIIF